MATKVEIPLETAEYIRDYLSELLAEWHWKSIGLERWSKEYKKLEEITTEFSEIVNGAKEGGNGL